MFKPVTALWGIMGTSWITCALILAFTGRPTWQIISALAFSVGTYSYMVSTLHPKDSKFKAVTTAISAVCFIIIGLFQGVWGGQNTTLMDFFVTIGVLGLIAAALIFFNKGRRRRVRSIRLIKTVTNNQPNAN
jgi:hypothetical protein